MALGGYRTVALLGAVTVHPLSRPASADNPVQIVDAPMSGVSVHFTPAYEVATSTNAFFRIRSDR